MGVRIIRVLEYYYLSQEDYEADIRRWNVSPNGVHDHGRTVIRSASTIAETTEDRPPLSRDVTAEALRADELGQD